MASDKVLDDKSSILDQSDCTVTRIDEIANELKIKITKQIDDAKAIFNQIDKNSSQKLDSAFDLASLQLKQHLIYKPNSAIKNVTEIKQIKFEENE